ncbi:MAG: TlpA disulfide reductase family protein [Polyangiaceae bacterium]
MTTPLFRAGGGALRVLFGAALSGALALTIAGCSGATGEGTAEVKTPDQAGSGESGGGSAPDFTLPALDGSTVHLSDFKGKVVLIDFWSTTCDPCLAEMPHLVDLYKANKDKGLVVLAVSLDGPESRAQVSTIVHDKEMIFPVLLDEETTVVAQYNPKREMPFSVVVGKDGSVAWKRAGYQPGSEAQITSAVEKALAK